MFAFVGQMGEKKIQVCLHSNLLEAAFEVLHPLEGCVNDFDRQVLGRLCFDTSVHLPPMFLDSLLPKQWATYRTASAMADSKTKHSSMHFFSMHFSSRLAVPGSHCSSDRVCQLLLDCYCCERSIPWVLIDLEKIRLGLVLFLFFRAIDSIDDPFRV